MNQSLILYVICYKTAVVATRCLQLHGIQFYYTHSDVKVYL